MQKKKLNDVFNQKQFYFESSSTGKSLFFGANSHGSHFCSTEEDSQQGCQMVYFQTKNRNWEGLAMEDVGVF
jgi:hypothetical protein